MTPRNEMRRLKELTETLAVLNKTAEPIEAEIIEIRKAILADMQETGVQRVTYDGLQAIEVVTKGFKVTDEARLHAALFEAGKFDTCVKTETKSTIVMPEVKKAIAAGFTLAGIEETVSRTLRINKVDE